MLSRRTPSNRTQLGGDGAGRALFVPASIVFIGLVLAACSGATPSDLFGGSGSATADGGSTSSSSSSSSSSGGTDASTSSSSSSSSGGNDAAPDSPVTLGDDDHVYCGKANGNDVYCPTGSICCARGNVQGGNLRYDTFECLSNKNQCNGQFDATLECDDKNDCKQNEFCCAQTMPFGNTSRYVRTECKANNCNGYSARMCQEGGSNECPNGSNCKPSQVLKDFGVCGQ
ncbi:MAG: hypothetical protein U0174_13175 [Polyangiaceae bacterium]